ncbi:hypothetical protein ACWC0C_42010 [Streptomyces sp. NPDC001709]
MGAARELRRLGGDRGRAGGSAAGRGRDEGLAFDFLTQWPLSLSVDQDSELGGVSAVESYAIYASGGKGLISWGATE